jgi:thiamine kinase-like enzyme
LRDEGFDGASRPVGVDPDGRERLEFIAGEVAVPPYPKWAQQDDALASLAELVRRFHDASRRIDVAGLDFSEEMADPAGGALVCHNDVCLENVVFRDGEAIGLLDFDFAAPGRPEHDLAQLARTCVPIDDDVNAARFGWQAVDKPARLRLVAEAYALDSSGRTELLQILSESIARGGAFLRRRVEAGDPNFVRMWTDMGGEERFDRRRRWWEERRGDFERALR